jgi:UDP-galactopyranose mutase
VYSEEIEGIHVHVYGGHVFHTSIERVWEYINRFAKFNNYINAPIANYRGELYNLPFNMNTFNRMWGVVSPAEAKAKIAAQVAEAGIMTPQNLEEQAINLVGRDIYEKLIKGYTEKQWGRPCRELPAFIIKRLPVRFTFDNNYFNDKYQGIPTNGYTAMAKNMFDGIIVQMDTDYFENKAELSRLAERTIFTGPIDQYFEYCFGSLDWRSLRFETEVLNVGNYQGVAAVNYTDSETPYTRVLEHKHFDHGTQAKTVVTREFPAAWELGMEAYYPINDEKNDTLFERYRALASAEENVVFGGRLGNYKYYDMDKAIDVALDVSEKELN